MVQRRGNRTDRLADIIQVIQLGRKTGKLTVERGQGEAREEGELTFERGTIKTARCARLTGYEALGQLETWGECRFTFIANDTERITGQYSKIVPTTAPQEAYNPGQARRVTDPALQGVVPSKTRPLPGVYPLSNNPCRIYDDETSMQMLIGGGFSRLHLRLFLLIDGQRSIQELARLLGKNVQEVQQLLQDLEGIVSVNG